MLNFYFKNKNYDKVIEYFTSVIPKVKKIKICNYQLHDFKNEFKDLYEKSILLNNQKSLNKSDKKADSSSLNEESALSKNINIKFHFNYNSSAIINQFNNKNFLSKDILFHLINTYKLSLFNSFDELLSLEEIDILKFDYQILTAKKVLKNMAGRCLLSDEVGLGKTIEASLVLKEYHTRGLVESALILTPPNLVHQWQNELLNKFKMKFSIFFHRKSLISLL